MADNPYPEISLLLQACFNADDDGSQYPVDEKHLQRLLYYHRIRPVFLSYIHRAEIPVGFKDSLMNDCQHIAIVNMLHTHELVKIITLLKESEIDAYAYKGSLWADWLYADTGQREFGDIDLLIPKEHFGSAVSLISSKAGYTIDDYRKFLLSDPQMKERFFRTDYHIPMVKETGHSMTVLEAHWNIAYPRLLFEFPATEWSQYARKHTLSNSEVLAFVNEYQFLVLLVHHGGKEEWSKLKYIADLAAYMNRYGYITNWDTVIKLAKEKGIFQLFLYSLGLLKGLGITWKKGWPEQIKPIDTAPFLQLWNAMPKQVSNSTWPYFKHGLSMHDGIKHKSRLVMAHLAYASEFRLLYHKAIWYKNHRS